MGAVEASVVKLALISLLGIGGAIEREVEMRT